MVSYLIVKIYKLKELRASSHLLLNIIKWVYILMTKKRLIALLVSMGFILIALHNLEEKLSWLLQCLNLIGLLMFLSLAYIVVKKIISEQK